MMSFQKLKEEFISSEQGYKMRDIITHARSYGQVFPEPCNLFRAFNDQASPIEDIRLVIVGDYPSVKDMGITGIPFSWEDFKINWNEKEPVTLQLIFKEIQQSLYPYMTNTMFFSEFGSADLSPWLKQGVFLLNRSLTYPMHDGWHGFTDKVIKELNDYGKPKVFMLWGEKARETAPLITRADHLILQGAHPRDEFMTPGSFLGCGHFIKAHLFMLENEQFEEETMDIFDLVPKEAIYSHMQKQIISKRICIPNNTVDNLKRWLCSFGQYRAQHVIDYRTNTITN